VTALGPADWDDIARLRAQVDELKAATPSPAPRARATKKAAPAGATRSAGITRSASAPQGAAPPAGRADPPKG
ncbi:MAG: hypothetical protein ACR2HM_03950, partial [Acidimicrobiales bacterium]